MSLEATAAILAEAASDPPAPQLAPRLTFPPFPTPPPGVHIIPFAQFKPKGIPVKFEATAEGEEPEIEFDGEGVPTVELRVKHELTEAELSRKKKKRKNGPAVVTVNGKERLQLWYEEWEEGEMLRRTSAINHHASRVDRFHQAAQEFKSTRKWPVGNSGLMRLWDAFRLYVGIIGSVQPNASKIFSQAPGPDGDDDEELFDGMIPVEKPKEVVTVDSETTSAKLGTDEEIASKNLSEEAQQRIIKRQEKKESRMEFFLNDPEMAMKIYFSAHYRDRGLMWEKVNCRDGPIVVQFFLEFLIRNRVIPETEKEFKKALDIVKAARKELPMTFVVGNLLPDALSIGFFHLFGSMSQRAIWGPEDAENLARFKEETRRIEEEQKQREQEAKEEEKKRFNTFIASNAEGSNLETIDPDNMDLSDEMQKDAIADNVDQNGLEVKADSAWADWGDDVASSGWGGVSGWGDPVKEDSPWDTEIMAQKSLMTVLGPTVLPHTHTTGIIESSTRRIAEVILPSKSGQGKKAKKRSAAEAVEDNLGKRFACVVLAPWKKIGNHINSDILPPTFLPDSRGHVVDPKKEPSHLPEGVTAHDPQTDSIHLLITPDIVEKLSESIGMGMCGTFVQIVRRDHAAEPEDEDTKCWERVDVLERDRKYGATGLNGQPTKWWYMEQQTATFASFHADRQYDDQDHE
ncbi:hypothetical protein BXZ70DRAFT_991439 [Cristinia sonorae]|uniref:Uncharacterized protein n=1 Tax=Cristinia sonorae TaxID=1940300 RepID=A0A8K0XNU0_9AGAR|nr:hypothetical protein BXZ70DRAFT_991439 [Cristinia sonorae]